MAPFAIKHHKKVDLSDSVEFALRVYHCRSYDPPSSATESEEEDEPVSSAKAAGKGRVSNRKLWRISEGGSKRTTTKARTSPKTQLLLTENSGDHLKSKQPQRKLHGETTEEAIRRMQPIGSSRRSHPMRSRTKRGQQPRTSSQQGLKR